MYSPPITKILPLLCSTLIEHDEVVLQAPPGAGKTTIVPLELMKQAWCVGKIIMLEPRRVATRAAAEHMAKSLGEKVGEQVGYRMRQETKTCHSTKIEIVTEGVFLRLLKNDPSLEDYSVVIFDEFHERSLEADLGLSLCLQARLLFREEQTLKLLVMSATLNGEETSQFLSNAPIVNAEGKAYPVDIHYQGQCKLSELVEKVTQTIHQALKTELGDILVFLPGQKQILQVKEQLYASISSEILLCPLYGALPLAEQLQAIKKLPSSSPFKRKIVLATDIAETSVTIEGVRVVVDSGFRREPCFDKNTGLSRLRTTRISQASAIQRAGRAGRLEPGTCFRVWSAEQVLALFNQAEIEQADLAPLVLHILDFGLEITKEGHIDTHLWLTPPPSNSIIQALELLKTLDAIDTKNGLCVLSPHGLDLSSFPAHPRLAHMMVRGAMIGMGEQASCLAAALSEANRPSSYGPNIANWIDKIPHSTDSWAKRVRKQAKLWSALLPPNKKHLQPTANAYEVLLPIAYPDRIAKKRESSQSYLLSNGRSATLTRANQLEQSEWLCAAEVGGESGAAEDRIFCALPISEKTFYNELSELVSQREIAHWDDQYQRFIAETQWFVGRIKIRSETSREVSPVLITSALTRLIRRDGLKALSFTDETQQLCARIQLLRSTPSCQPEHIPNWPDMSENGLLTTLEDWLVPHITGITSLKALRKLDVKAILQGLLTWPLPQYLDDLAPTHFRVPSGSNIRIDYLSQPPVLAVKLQEMFGCHHTPTIANNSIALTIHLLSPARRPLQITQDLKGFWETSYHEVKKEMKGRYPKHPWPDNPLEALPTKHTKKRIN